MAFTASTGQQAAMPVQTTPSSTTITSSGLLISGASLAPATPVPATADEITFVGIQSGTIQSDSTFEVQISTNGTNYGTVKSFTNAEIVQTRGFASVVKVGLGNYFRVQFIAASTTGAGNGVTVRWRN